MKKNETIYLNNLSTGYLGKKAVKVVAEHISASIYSGELTCLLGANGVGKSTLLRTLSGFQPKLGGEIQLLGKNLESYSDKELSKVLGVVLTEKCDLYNLSVEELVGLGRMPYTGFWGTLNAADREVVAHAMELTGITELAGRMAHTLSDGERQKAMIAKALAQETPVIFLDEPTAFLDFPSKVEMLLLLHKLSRQTEKTIFLSTHDLELALQIADKIWLMDTRGVSIGTPEDLALNGSLEGFFGRKNVCFEPHTGLFSVAHMCVGKVCLTGGQGVRADMVRKALYRTGLLVESGSDAEAIVCVAQDYFEVLVAGKSRCKATSIEEVLHTLELFV